MIDSVLGAGQSGSRAAGTGNRYRRMVRPVVSLTIGGEMYGPTIKQPSAWLPLAMSFGALALVIGHIAVSGVAPETDEGTAAHL